MPRVIQFAIGAHDPEQEANFYRSVLGWRITRKDMALPWGAIPSWKIETGPNDNPGIDGFMLQRPGPGTITVNLVEVLGTAPQRSLQCLAANGSPSFTTPLPPR
jgi:predicted enzyme related to lactoylglutathione lyase